MPATTPAAQRGTLKEAQRVCDNLIQMVEKVTLYHCDFSEFLTEFEAAAGRLIDALHALNWPLGHRLEYFRLPDDTSCRPFTDLGLPLDWTQGLPKTDANLIRGWLWHMMSLRDFDLRDSLADIKRTRSRKPGAGRPTDPATVKLCREVENVYAQERTLYTKGGMTPPDVHARLKALTAADILHRINENNDHLHPLHGPESENVKKQVRRSWAWRVLREAEWPARPEEEPNELVAKDWQWALENGMRAGQN